MLNLEELRGVLESLQHPPRYVDLRVVESREYRVSLREGSFETDESTKAKVVSRALDSGYGVASTSRIGLEGCREAVKTALKEARAAEGGRVGLAPVRVEQGRVTHPARKRFDTEEARRLLMHLRDLLKSTLGPYYVRSEITLTYEEVGSKLATSEGTEVEEWSPLIDLKIYVEVRDYTAGSASWVVGGKGGFEVVASRPWEEIIKEVAGRALDQARAHLLSPLYRGKKFKVVFDSEATGALARGVASLLSADSYSPTLLAQLQVPEGLVVVDNPLVPGAYGSFLWDDEGVRGRRKVLLSRGRIDLLHTRLTASQGGVPGNAHGVTGLPRPAMSNVYIEPGDWGVREIFEETGRGIFVRGVVRAEVEPSEGRLELVPEIAYLIERKEVRTPIRQLKVIDRLPNLVAQIDAIAGVAALRPKLEGDIAAAEGGPYIRVAAARCS
jgi:TldD protein